MIQGVVDLPDWHLQRTDLPFVIEPLLVREQLLHVEEAALPLPRQEDLQDGVHVLVECVLVRELAHQLVDLIVCEGLISHIFYICGCGLKKL